MPDFRDFSKGLTLQAPRDAFSTGPLSGFATAAVADNVRVTELGVSVAPGYVRASETPFPARPRGLHRYKRATATAFDKMLVVANGSLYQADYGTTSFSTTGAVNTTARTRMITFGSDCLITNAIDGIRKFDGTTLGAITFTGTLFDPELDKPTILAVRDNRVFFTGAASNPFRIWTPRPNTYTDFLSSLADAFDVNVGDGFGVNGLYATTAGNLIIFKPTNVHVLTGVGPSDSPVSPFNLLTYSRETGLVATDAIQPASSDLFFLSPTGLKQLGYTKDKGGAVSNTLQDSDPLARIQPVFDAVTPESLKDSSLVFNRETQELYLSLSNLARRDAYTYYIKKEGIARRPAIDIDLQWADRDGHYFTTVNPPYYLYKMDPSATKFDTASFPVLWQTKFFSAGESNTRKSFSKLAVYFRRAPAMATKVVLLYKLPDGSISVDVLFASSPQSNDVWDAGLWDSARWDALADVVTRRSRLQKCNSVAIRVQADSTSRVRFDSISIDVEARGSNQR